MSQRNNSDILKGRFVRQVLSGATADLDKGQRAYITSRGFNEANGWNDRSFTVTNNQLDYTHLKKHRFVDMRFRNSSKGRNRKKSHPIHNRPIFGVYNNIIRELAFGFTEEIKAQMRNLED